MAGEWDRKPSRDRVRLLLKHYIEDLVVGVVGEQSCRLSIPKLSHFRRTHIVLLYCSSTVCYIK